MLLHRCCWRLVGCADRLTPRLPTRKAWYAAAANKPTALRILLRHGADPMASVTEAGNRHRSMFDVAMCVQLV